MIGIRLVSGTLIAAVMPLMAASTSISEDAVAMPPFQPHVDMKTFMAHVPYSVRRSDLESQRNRYRRER